MANTELVLVADDEDEDRLPILDIVRGDGFQTHEARNGSQAIELLEKNHYDLVITDIVMPGATGFEVLRVARARNPQVICIVMTGHGSLESAIDALRLGAYSYLLKPCDPASVRNCLQRGLEKQRLTKELQLRNQELETLNSELDARVQAATSELRGLNLRIQNEMASLQEVDKLKSAFLANVSHDLKTPLTSIVGYAEFLLTNDELSLPPQEKDSLAKICQSAAHMQELINQLVEAARLTSGKIKLNPRALDVTEFLGEAAAMVLTQAQAKGLSLHTHWEGKESVVLHADHSRLLEILSNLLSNALRFTPSGGRILLRAWPEKDFIHFSVEDSGPGIAAQHQARIFERFYQVEKAAERNSQGLGLGLSIARDLVELHGGRIWVQSAPGQGTQFHFTILQGLKETAASAGRDRTA